MDGNSSSGKNKKRHEIIRQYQNVTLADGREGCVVEIYGDQDVFSVDVDIGPEEWENIEFKREDIIDPP